MARVMVIAGGTWQCPIVQLAKKMGHYVICSNLYPDSPAFRYADVGLVANVLDMEKNLEYAREYNVDVVLTEQTDIAVPTVAYIAEQLGIKGITSEIAKRFTDKRIMRELTEKAGFVSPGYAVCREREDAKKVVDLIGKSIIKPLDGQSSRGCHVINHSEEIDAYFEDCIQYSNCDRAVIIEEFIEGTEFTVDGIKTEEEYIVTAISEKEHYDYNPSVAKRLLFSENNSRFDYEKLRKINKKMVEILELPFGITHAEYKYRDGEFYLIEIAARGGGTKISSDIVPVISGINSNEIFLRTLLGEKVRINRQRQHEYAVLGFFDINPGRVKAISGIEDARALNGVLDVCLEVSVGDRVELAQDDRSRCGYYILYADSLAELQALEDRVLGLVKVDIEKGA